MKPKSILRILPLVILFAIANNIYSQSPEAFQYQAVIRNADGSVLPNTDITLDVSIQNSSGTVYSESHSLKTNDYGLITTQIGGGSVTSGSMSSIEWGSDVHYLSVSMSDGTDTVDMGTTQILSVPYALEAKHAATTDAFTLTSPNGTVFTLSVDDAGNIEAISLSATVNSSDISCYGSSDGAIIVSDASGGSGNYEYSINGGSTWQMGATFTGLSVSAYHVMIRDRDNPSNSKTLNSNVSITEPPQLSANIASSNNTCYGDAQGTITLSNAQGGYGTYAYSINGGSSWQTNPAYTGLPAETYNVLLRDNANTSCTVSINSSLEITEPIILSANLGSTNLTANDSGDGSITISSPTGGSGSYEYSIDGGISWQSSGSFTGLDADTYNVMMRDAVNTACEKTLNGSLQVNEPGDLTATVTPTNITCYGGSDGAIAMTNPSGGYSGNYEYSIDGGTSWQVSGAFETLIAGTYNVMMRDKDNPGNQKTLNATLEITQLDELTATLNSSNLTSNGSADGAITISSPSGGSGSYEYSIDGGTSWQSSGSFTGLDAGTYNVIMRDKDHTGCEHTLNGSLVLTEPGPAINTVTDYDGNTYQTITIGTQTWMAENLRVTHYSDGTAIPYINDNTTWKNLGDNNTDRGYTVQNNNTNNELEAFGALYSYAAVINGTPFNGTDPVQGVCPTGWHVPSDEEWKTLEGELGMSTTDQDNTSWRGTDEGNKLKSATGWYNSGNGNNSSGMNILPGGNRTHDAGLLTNLGTKSYFWTSTESGNEAYWRYMDYLEDRIHRTLYVKSQGFSVRCLKD
jgi:uncharacterized protein (TIGR02145 family)